MATGAPVLCPGTAVMSPRTPSRPGGCACPCAGTTLLLLVASRPGLALVGEKLLRWLGLDLRKTDQRGRDAVGVAIDRRNSKFGAMLLARCCCCWSLGWGFAMWALERWHMRPGLSGIRAAAC